MAICEHFEIDFIYKINGSILVFVHAFAVVQTSQKSNHTISIRNSLNFLKNMTESRWWNYINIKFAFISTKIASNDKRTSWKDATTLICDAWTCTELRSRFRSFIFLIIKYVELFYWEKPCLQTIISFNFFLVSIALKSY